MVGKAEGYPHKKNMKSEHGWGNPKLLLTRAKLLISRLMRSPAPEPVPSTPASIDSDVGTTEATPALPKPPPPLSPHARNGAGSQQRPEKPTLSPAPAPEGTWPPPRPTARLGSSSGNEERF